MKTRFTNFTMYSCSQYVNGLFKMFRQEPTANSLDFILKMHIIDNKILINQNNSKCFIV